MLVGLVVIPASAEATEGCGTGRNETLLVQDGDHSPLGSRPTIYLVRADTCHATATATGLDARAGEQTTCVDRANTVSAVFGLLGMTGNVGVPIAIAGSATSYAIGAYCAETRRILQAAALGIRQATQLCGTQGIRYIVEFNPQGRARVRAASCQLLDRTKDDSPPDGVGKQFLDVNLVPAPHDPTGPDQLCVANSGVVSYFPHSPDGGATVNFWKVFYDGRVGGEQAYRFLLYNELTGKYDIDKGTNSTMCPTPPPAPGEPPLTPPPPPLPPGQPATGDASVCWNSTIRSVWEVPGYIQYEQLTFDSSYGEVWYGTVIKHFRYTRSVWNGTAWNDDGHRPQDYVCNNYHQGPGNWTWTFPPNIEPVPLP